MTDATEYLRARDIARLTGVSNGTVVDIYADYAISGGSLRTRPSMQALLNQAKRGKFDYVIAEALDRVSRDQEDIAAIYKRLRHSDTRLLTLGHAPGSRDATTI